MEIKTYSLSDEKDLFDMLSEDADFKVYCEDSNIEKYKAALASSITFLVYENDELCECIRCRGDDGFGVYVYDLLVKKSKRGKSIGRAFIEKICFSFPSETIYVMTDVDAYYEKQGYRRMGSIFEILNDRNREKT